MALLAVCILQVALSVSAQAQSVLATGKWYKIGVLGSGVYQLDYAKLTQIDPAFATADPRLFRLFGNGGAPLPQPNNAPRPIDLVENAIQVRGETDGRFDAGDALLFYAQGPRTISRDAKTGRFQHQFNPYTDTTFYFLTIGPTNGKRIATRPADVLTSGPISSTFTDYAFYERDTTKVPGVNSGRDWVGDSYGFYPQQSVSFRLPGRVANVPSLVTLSAVAVSLQPSAFSVTQGTQSVVRASFPAISSYIYAPRGAPQVASGQAVLPNTSDELVFTLTYDAQGASGAAAYLDYLAVQTSRTIAQYEQPSWVRSGRGRYVATQATNDLLIWDVQQPTTPVQQAYTLANGQANWSVADSASFFLHTARNLSAPATITRLANQNLRGQPTPNLLIVCPDAWRDQAERLAQFRRDNDKLTVLVVSPQQIYNEFSTGQQDPTAIRDYCRFLSGRASGSANTLRYLLLMGDASYDFRNKAGLLSAAQQANLVPTYESRESLDPVRSFSSDDYFGFLKDTDGDWAETPTGNHLLDIGVGRLAVKTPTEARNVVDKLIRYASDKRLLGDWRSRLTLVADDGDYNIHNQDADRLAAMVEAYHPEFRPERLFLAQYPKDTTGKDALDRPIEKAPQVNQAIGRAIDDGRLIINYAGHGGTSGWAQEQILTVGDILAWKNSRLPLFVTATCAFGRYDNPVEVSGAELAQLDRAGGAIGLLTTARPVYANTNYLLNEAFYRAIFKAIESNGQATAGTLPRLGDVMRDTKNNSLSDVLNRNFTLLGDPSMRLAYPQNSITFTRLNGRTLAPARPDTIRAGQRITLEGEIRTAGGTAVSDGVPLSTFNGTARVLVYDKATRLRTRETPDAESYAYNAFQSLLFAGHATVQQGRFSVSFTVPADVVPNFGFGRVQAYAIQTDSTTDAVGAYAQLVMGGTASPGDTDTRPPSLTLSLVGANPAAERPTVVGPLVQVRLQVADETGVNLTQTTANRGPTLQLDTNLPFRIADYYTGAADGQQGQFVIPLGNLAAGTYTIRAQVFDLSNNSAQATLTFVVSDKPGLAIQRLVAAPNPVQAQSNWLMTHNQAGQHLNWTWRLLDASGRIVTERQDSCYDCAETVQIGRYDAQTMPLATGIYILQVQAQNPETGEQTTASTRLLNRNE
ncbi:type IX secretion system sortase PorU [Fibrella sp. WM1]|uniref:type IX secretion system sortase PorU n=1 Tax=Fibrella musci TaxID=3242485 RepID=UPI003521810C